MNTQTYSFSESRKEGYLLIVYRGTSEKKGRDIIVETSAAAPDILPSESRKAVST